MWHDGTMEMYVSALFRHCFGAIKEYQTHFGKMEAKNEERKKAGIVMALIWHCFGTVMALFWQAKFDTTGELIS